MTGLGDSYELTGGGVFQHVRAGGVDRIPPFDARSGDHYWILPITYHVADPAGMYNPNAPQQHFDLENLVLVTAVGCWYCEQVWSRLLATRRCKGHP